MSGRTKNWFTWTLLALLPGVTGWFIVLTQEQIQRNRAETFRSISQQQKEDFLQMYDQWSRLSPEEKTENPWGSGPYGGPDIQKKLFQNQDERLLADLPELLSDSSDVPHELGNMLYGIGWRNKLEDYRKQIEYREILGICSSTLMLVGFVGLIIGTTTYVREKISLLRMKNSDTAEEELPPEKKSSSSSSPDQIPAPAADTPDKPKEEKEEVHLFTKKKAPQKSADPSSQTDAGSKAPAAEDSPSGKPGSGKKKSKKSGGTSPKEKEADTSVAVLNGMTDEETGVDGDPLLSSLMTPEPVAKELTELTEQMSAIREFAAEQQSQMKKLQDGYDWTLIKRFCLRIIRCIDNIDDRIKTLKTDKTSAGVLVDIRDELIFALESSGVEPFEPDINREYRGLEKYAEAIKERQTNKDPEKTGKIAEVVRSGYQYLIDDNEVKIVRCAQVKLYA